MLRQLGAILAATIVVAALMLGSVFVLAAAGILPGPTGFDWRTILLWACCLLSCVAGGWTFTRVARHSSRDAARFLVLIYVVSAALHAFEAWRGETPWSWTREVYGIAMFASFWLGVWLGNRKR